MFTRAFLRSVGTAALLSLVLIHSAQGRPPSSQSRGDSTHGTLVNGVPMPLKGEAFRVLPITVKRGFYYGTSELIEALKTAANKVRTLHPGSVLRLGNLSRLGGGDIPQSRSHNSGRDADLAFYFRDALQKDAQPRSLLHVLNTGKTKNGSLVFDIGRNWDLLHALISNPDVQVQWIFGANWLRKPLLEYARSTGVPLRTQIRMETILKQPSDSAPHNDHFHFRVYCSEEDSLASGCIDYGTRWPWVPTYTAKKEVYKSRLEKQALNPGEEIQKRREALKKLSALRARDRVHSLLPLLHEEELESAMRTLITQTRAVEAVPALLQQLALATTGARKGSLIDTLAQLRTNQVKAPLIAGLGNQDIPLPTRTRALNALVRLRSQKAVPTLISLLNHPNEAWRLSVASALGQLTNHAFPLPADWEAWWKQNEDASMREWIRAGYQQWGCASCETGTWSARILSLIQAINGPPHISWNAQRDLNSLTGNGTRSTSWNPQKAHKYWQKWWKGAKKRYGS